MQIFLVLPKKNSVRYKNKLYGIFDRRCQGIYTFAEVPVVKGSADISVEDDCT